MEHKDIFQSMESFEGWLSSKKDETNLERAGILGDEWKDFDRVLESLIADGHISAFDLTIEEDAKAVVDGVVKEIGDSFQIYEEGHQGDIWTHHIFNPYKYDTRIPRHLMQTFETYGTDIPTLRDKLAEQMTVSPKTFIVGAVPCHWADRNTPERVYVERIAQGLTFSYDIEPQRAGLVLLQSWIMGKLIDIGRLEMQVREGDPNLLLKAPYALNWILDELLEGIGDPAQYKKRMFEE